MVHTAALGDLLSHKDVTSHKVQKLGWLWIGQTLGVVFQAHDQPYIFSLPLPLAILGVLSLSLSACVHTCVYICVYVHMCAEACSM